MVDSFEQPNRRPRYQRKRYDSGRKKRHTLRVRLTVDEAMRKVIDVSGSVPGPRSDIKLIEESGVLKRLPQGVGKMGDSGYQGMPVLSACRVWVSPRKNPRDGAGRVRPARDVTVCAGLRPT